MGQRHQLFIIARINGKYRSLAAVHHQWLYGHTALRRCLSTLNILQDPNNRVPLETEIALAGTYDEAIWGKNKDDRYAIDVKFPFITTCLILGASFGVEDAYLHEVHVEPWQMAYNQGDNNNGITIFDVSDPCRVRYCFVDFCGMESEREVQLMAPLTARAYLEAYYELDKAEYHQLLPLVEKFAVWSLIETTVLEDTWPGEGWEEPTYLPKIETIAEDVEDQASVRLNALSLREVTLGKLANAVAHCEEIDPQVLSEAEVLTDFWPKVKEQLYADAGNLTYSPSLLQILFKSLKSEIYVDLSPFRKLSMSDLGDLVHRLSHEGNLAELNLSYRLDISKDDIRTLLDNIEGTKCGLYIMGNISASAADIAVFGRGIDVYQPEIFKRSIMKPSYNDPAQTPLKFATLHSVVQVVWIAISSGFLCDEKSYIDNELVWDSLHTRDEPTQRFSLFVDPSVVSFKRYPLTDVPLPLVRLLAGLKSLLQWMSGSNMLGAYEISKGIASAFSLGATGTRLRGGLGPLSTELNLLNGYNGAKRGHLEPGEWAILLIHPCCDQKMVRDPEVKGDYVEIPAARTIERMGKKTPMNLDQVNYALVGHKEGSDMYAVADVPTFLKGLGDREATKLADWWQGQVEENTFLHFYDKPDIQDILKKIYPSTVGAKGAA